MKKMEGGITVNITGRSHGNESQANEGDVNSILLHLFVFFLCPCTGVETGSGRVAGGS